MRGPWRRAWRKWRNWPTAFKKDGTVTAGNASGINDGAAALLLMSAAKAKEMGLEPMVKDKILRSGGVDPAYMGLGVIPAVKGALEKAKLSVKDLDVVELNEAFASQALGCIKELGFDMERPIFTAAASRWDIPSELPAAGCWSRWHTKCSAATSNTAWRPCASAAAWALPW